jgi:dolichyl-phosphate-mannose-protein mannosyltransferase
VAEPALGAAEGGPTTARVSTLARLIHLLRDPETILPAIFVLALALRIVWLDQPPGALIFDEAYYVNAARVIAGLPVEPGAHYSGSPVDLDPNAEHPPLAKVLIAGSMLVFGDNGLGWRLPSVAAGMVALLAFYAILRRLGAGPWLSILALGLLAFDNLTLVHGRIGTLDMLALAPTLVAAWLALRGRWLLAGILFGIAALVKLTALFGLLAVLLGLALELFQARRIRPSQVRPLGQGAILTGSFLVVLLGGLWVLDARFTTFSSPVDHLRHMVTYASALDRPGRDRTLGCAGSSAPWQWLVNDCEIGYLRVSDNPTGDPASSRTTVEFRGALNPVLASSIPLGILFLVWLSWRRDDRLARWATLWGAATYLPYVVFGLLTERIMYLYYLVPAVPAIAIAAAVLLVRAGLPRFVGWGFVAAFAIGVVAYFPFRQPP